MRYLETGVRRLRLLIGVLGTLLAADAAWSQTEETLPAACDPELIAASQNLEFPYQSRGEGYCEGVVRVPHSGELSLLSLTLGSVGRVDTSLSIRRPDGAQDGPIYFRGIDVRPGSTYRLDGTLSGASINVDFKPATTAGKLSSDHLGLVGWTIAGANRIYVPLLVGGQSADDVVVVFSSDLPAVHIKAQICEGGVCGAQRVLRRDVPAGGSAELRIPRSAVARQVEVKAVALLLGNRFKTQSISVLAPAK